jgi:hypothetical protein
MRIRSTKPEFWRSQTISRFDWETRLVLKALESYVDDNGVGKDQVVIFCADAFPHDLAKSSEVCAKVSRSLAQLSEAGLIVRYKVGGEPLVYVRRWKLWQYIDKPKAGRFRRPDGTLHYREEVDESIGAGQGVTDPVDDIEIREVSPKVREECAKSSGSYPQIQSGEQGNRGTEEKESCATQLRVPAPSQHFVEFWAAYPLRRDKRKAEKAYAAALKRADPNTILEGAQRYAADPNRDDRFTKYAEGWLNGDGWLDEPLPTRNGHTVTKVDWENL